ncbi:MAG: PilT/PilU family type 4a pilus ATPase [Verrucomicrobiota bacterium]
MEQVQPNTRLGQLLAWCEAREASDLHAQVGKPFAIRHHGRLERIPEDQFAAPSAGALNQLLAESFSSAICDRIAASREVDLSFYFCGQRYRANFSKQLGQQSFSFRLVPQQRLKLKDLQLPDSLRDLVSELRGLILLTGPAGQGKSTTARALIQEINESRAVRIITIEDPIEYVFQDAQAQFEQREVGIDTASFAEGIRNAMRQDPNVIFIGEIRDRESLYAALQAAETGHLVLTTLHADSVPQALGRLREFYPMAEQPNVSALLARSLNSVVSQRLIPNCVGTRTPCLEILKRDAGVQEAIQQNNLHVLSGIIEGAVNQGMHTFDQYLVELLAAGIVSEAVARQYAVNKHRLDLILRGIETSQPILKPDR